MGILSAIVWDYDGIIFTLGSYEFRWYSILFGAGFILSYFLLKKRFDEDKIDLRKLETLTLYVFLGTVIGARLGHCLFYEPETYLHNGISGFLNMLLPFTIDPFEFTGYKGLASHGGAIGILIAIFIYCKKESMGLLWVLDQLALVIPLAGMCIRLGNFMNSEIVGNPTTSAFAVDFKQAYPYTGAVHPAQLYEAISYLIIFFVLRYLYKQHRKQEGFIFGLFLMLLFGARFFLEFFKPFQAEFLLGMQNPLAINMGQILSIPFVLIGLYLVIKKRENQPIVEV